MRRTIGGALDMAALALLTGRHDEHRMRHFDDLDREQQAEAIRELAVRDWPSATLLERQSSRRR
jgi:hypothetical protein